MQKLDLIFFCFQKTIYSHARFYPTHHYWAVRLLKLEETLSLTNFPRSIKNREKKHLSEWRKEESLVRSLSVSRLKTLGNYFEGHRVKLSTHLSVPFQPVFKITSLYLCVCYIFSFRLRSSTNKSVFVYVCVFMYFLCKLCPRYFIVLAIFLVGPQCFIWNQYNLIFLL